MFQLNCSDRGLIGSIKARSKGRALNAEERNALEKIASRGLGVSQGRRGSSDLRQEQPDEEVCYLDVESATVPELQAWELKFS